MAKVYDQAAGSFGGVQINEKLGMMFAAKLTDGLNFKDDFIIAYKVGKIFFLIQFLVSINEL